jgi:hypothetical protein
MSIPAPGKPIARVSLNSATALNGGGDPFAGFRWLDLMMRGSASVTVIDLDDEFIEAGHGPRN